MFKRLFAFLLLTLSIQPAQADWVPPYWIPDPDVVWASQDGVTWDPYDDTVTTIYGSSGYATSANGPYTHYVDQTAGNCSDSTNGTVAQPRCTIPTTITAGQVVEVHGGATKYALPGSGFLQISITGTSSAPAFLRYIDNSGHSGSAAGNGFDTLEYACQNAIIEGEQQFRVKVDLGVAGSSHHCVYRNGEPSWTPRQILNVHATNAVIYNNNIHHSIGDDRHCLYIGGSAQYVWITDNEISYCGGNGLQFTQSANPGPSYIFIGRNTWHHNKETGMASKQAFKILATQNETYANQYPGQKGDTYTVPDAATEPLYATYGFPTTATNGSAGDGSAAIWGADVCTGCTTTDRVYYAYNYDHDNGNSHPNGQTKGRNVRFEDVTNAYYFQNISTTSIDDVYSVEKNGPNTVCNNTFIDKDGSTTLYWGFRPIVTVEWVNNITVAESAGILLRVEDQQPANNSDLVTNLFWDTSGTMNYHWKNTTDASLTTAAEINALPSDNGTISGNLFEDPVFTDYDGEDYSLDSLSPAIDVGTDCMTGIKSDFQTDFGAYGYNAQLIDFDGNTVPTTNIDLGALQFGSSPPAPVDNVPVCVTCSQGTSQNRKQYTAGDASFTQAMVMTDDDTDPVTITGFSCTDTSGASGTWSMNTTPDPDQIEFSGTTAVGTVDCTWEMIDSGNSNTAAAFYMQFSTAEAQVPPVVQAISDQANVETDTVNWASGVTLTNGDALISCSFSGCPSNLTQNLTITAGQDTFGANPSSFLVTGDLPEDAVGGSDLFPITVVTSEDNASGTSTFSGDPVVACQFMRSGSATTADDFTINSISGDALFASGDADGGAAITYRCWKWDSTAGGSLAWAATFASPANVGVIILELNSTPDSFGTPVISEDVTVNDTETNLSTNVTGHSGDLILNILMMTDSSAWTPANTINTSDTTLTTHDGNTREVQAWVVNAAADDDETYTITASNGLVVDSAAFVSIPIVPGTGSITGAATNSPHTCGVTCSDNDGASDVVNFTWTVNTSGSNLPPVAGDDSYIYSPGEQNDYTESDSLLNNDIDDQPLTVTTTPVTPPGSGTLTLNTDGTFSWTPGDGYKSTTFFEYQVCDDQTPALCDTGRADLIPIAAPIITAPTSASTYSENVEEGSSTALASISASNVSTYSKGVSQDCSFFTINSSTGARTWTAGTAPTYTGVDDAYPCTYTASNGSGDDTITITVNVTDDGVVASAPDIFSNGGEATAILAVAENQKHITYARAYNTTSWALCGGTNDDLINIASTTTSVGTFTTDFGTDANQLTATAHNLIVGEAITLTTTGTLPAPLATGTTYYVRAVNDANNIEIDTDLSGAVIILTDDGTGTHTITRENPIAKIEFDDNADYETSPTYLTPLTPFYNFCVQPTGPGGTDMQTLAVAITNVAEQPVVTSPDEATIQDGSTTVSPQQTCPNEATAQFVEVTDTGNLFTISTSGVITKGTAAVFDFDTPANNLFSYTYKCTASGASDSANKTITIEVIKPGCFLGDRDRRSTFRSMFNRVVRDLKGCDIL